MVRDSQLLTLAVLRGSGAAYQWGERVRVSVYLSLLGSQPADSSPGGAVPSQGA